MLASQIQELQGDLLEQPVDVIVNAWNRNLIPWWLLLPQGVSGAIKKRAGYAPFRELRRHGVLPLGGAVLTSAGCLPYRGIIHVAGINHFWRASRYSIQQALVRRGHSNGCWKHYRTSTARRKCGWCNTTGNANRGLRRAGLVVFRVC